MEWNERHGIQNVMLTKSTHQWMDVDVYHNIGPNHWCTVPIKFKAKTDAYSSLLVILYFHSGSRLSLVGREHLYIITTPYHYFFFQYFQCLVWLQKAFHHKTQFSFRFDAINLQSCGWMWLSFNVILSAQSHKIGLYSHSFSISQILNAVTFSHKTEMISVYNSFKAITLLSKICHPIIP